MQTFELSQELYGHTNSARCCIFLYDNPNGYFAVSGGQDNSILLWKQEGPEPDDVVVKTIHHSCWITCLLALKNGCFVSGGYDGCIRIYSADGDIIGELNGHSNGVISLSHGPNDSIISGSWDGSARIWDINFLREISKVDGMENAVTAIALDDNTLLTTSTGMKDVTDNVTGYCARIWRNGQVIKTLHYHYASIRCCYPIYNQHSTQDIATSYLGKTIGFLTGGNDGKMIVCDNEGNKLLSCETPPNGEGKYPFIMKMKSISLSNKMEDNYFISVSEDSNARIWKYHSLQQVIKHPNSLWDVDIQEHDGGYRIITACSDGIVRIFHSNPKYWLTEELRNKYKDLCDLKESELAAKIGVNVDTLPDYSLRSEYRGNRDGEIKMFRKEDKGFVYRWSTQSNTWIEIGEVIGTEDTVHKLPVEVETSQGIQTLTLEYQDNQNPYEAAQAFIDRYQLEQDYLDEIAQHIMKERGSTKMTIDQAKPRESFQSSIYPDNHYIQHTRLPVAGIMKKLNEFNMKIYEMHLEDFVIAPSDLNTLEEFLTTLSKEQSIKPIDTKIIHILQRLLQWPVSMIFPVLDIMKNCVLLPNGISILSSSPSFDFSYFITSLQVGETPNAVFIVLFRLIANILCVHSNQWIITQLHSLLQLCKVVTITEDKQINQAISSFLVNVSIYLSENKSIQLEEKNRLLDTVVAVSCDLINRSVDEVVLSRVFTAMSNALLMNPRSIQVIDQQARQIIQNTHFTGDLQTRCVETSRLLLFLDSTFYLVCFQCYYYFSFLLFIFIQLTILFSYSGKE